MQYKKIQNLKNKSKNKKFNFIKHFKIRNQKILLNNKLLNIILFNFMLLNLAF